jgi:SAM-dependent methyltransferase
MLGCHLHGLDWRRPRSLWNHQAHGRLSDLEVYRRHPLLEQQWSVFQASGGRAALGPSERWYAARLEESTGPVCELACGYGRLLVAAARAGRPVFGTDAVPERIDAARTLFAEMRFDSDFEVMRLPEVPKGQQFSDVVLACNALGYVLSERDKAKLFDRIHDALLPGGRLLMDHGRGSAVLRALGRWPGLRGSLRASGDQMRSALRWDREQDCVIEQFIEQTEDGSVLASTDQFRFTSVRRTLAMLKHAGFQLTQVCGSFTGEPLRPWSRRVVAVAQRR